VLGHRQPVSRRFRVTGTLVLLGLAAVPAPAAEAAPEPKNQIGLTAGIEVIPCTTSGGVHLDFSSSVVFGVDYARRLRAGGSTGFYFEVPFSAAPHHSIDSASASTPGSMATLFLTPSFRVNFLPQGAVSPWVSVGAGYGLYQGSTSLRDGTKNPSRFASVVAFQWGGGIDIRTPMRIGVPVHLRFEARDFYTLDSLDSNTGGSGDQHNVVVNAGILMLW